MVRSFPDPKQARDAEVDLIDQRQVFVAFGVLDFIDANRVDLSQDAVFEAPGDDVFDGVEDLFPGSAKRFGGFLPRKAARPAGQNSI